MVFKTATIASAVIMSLACFGSGLAQGSRGAATTRSAAALAQPEPTCEKILAVSPDAPIDIEWRVQSRKLIEVISNDTVVRKLTTELRDLEMKDVSGKSLKTADLIEVQPIQSPINVGRALHIAITVKQTPAVKPGLYAGSLYLALEGDNAPKSCSKRLSVRVTVPDATPFADKVTLRQYRPLPIPLPFQYVGCLWYDCVIRMRGPVTSLTDSGAGETPLGMVQNTNGHTAMVYLANQQPAPGSGVIDLALDVRGMAFAGAYDGQMRLNPSSENARSVQLSLVVTDWFLWPILVIALSIWLGLRAQRYLNVERTLWRLRGQEAALGVAFKESNQKFQTAAAGTSYATYSVSEALAEARKGLRKKLNSLRSATGTTLDPNHQDYKSVLDALESLRKQIAAWGGFADELAALQLALREESDLGTPPAAYKKKLPAIFAAYGALLVGKVLELAGFTETRDQVVQATKGAGLWYALKERLDRGDQRYAELKPFEANMSLDEQKGLADALGGLLTTRLSLWEAKDIAAVEALSVAAGILETTEDNLRKLAVKYLTESVRGLAVAEALTSRGNLANLSSVFGLGTGPDDEPADDAERERYYADATNKWDKRLTWLAFAIATLTALHQYYLGQPFGTLKDYVGLLLLGFGTKLTVDAVSAMVGWVSRGQSLETIRRLAGRT